MNLCSIRTDHNPELHSREMIYYKNLNLYMNDLICSEHSDSLEHSVGKMSNISNDLVYFFGSFINEKEM
jgi:hypothetical protein